jgi:putative transposase
MSGMSRIARAVAPGLPHHVTQRGNRRQQTFFHDTDYTTYIELMHKWCTCHSVEIWAYCLMPNHVHLIAVPGDEESLASAIGEAHKRYTKIINEREGWRGHLWQGRFASYVMDETYLLTCARYIEMNPVRAGLVAAPQDWPWSSARAHINRRDGRLATVAPLVDLVDADWSDFLRIGEDEDIIETLRKHEGTGRPLGSPRFVDTVEQRLGRLLRPGKVGRRRGRGPK